MIYLKRFNESIHIGMYKMQQLCKKYDITNYIINDDNSVDVHGSLNFTKSLFRNKKTYVPIKLGRLSGSFHCNYNKLISLDNCPTSVEDDYSIAHNNLKSLKGCPPSCYSFYCNDNELESLEYCPNVVDDFICSRNKLTSLEYAPESIGGTFDCSSNNIKSFEFAPKYCEKFICTGCPINIIWLMFMDYSKIELFNDYDIIRGDDIIINRLNDFFKDIGEFTTSSFPSNLRKLGESYNII